MIMERATLASVAAAANVSRQTVSNVLHAPERVAPATLDRVLATIAAQGYRPSLAARQLRTRRSRTLGLRLEPWGNGISGAVLDRFLHALTEQAQQAGYRTVLFTAADDAEEVARYDELLSTTEIDGFVLTSTHAGDARTAWLARREVPFATFGRAWGVEGTAPDHPWVDVDGAAGTREATEHLLAAGHEVAFLGWPRGSGSGDDRHRGWARAMEAAGRTGAQARVDDVTAQATAATAALLAGPRPPTAVVCASDTLALGARAHAVTARVPLAVVGFDDTPVAAALGISSVAQPLAAAAALVLSLLLDQLDGRVGATQHLLAPSLVLRGPTT